MWHNHPMPDAERYLVADELAIQWRTDATCWLDVAEFESHMRQAGSAAGADDRVLEQLVTLYEGCRDYRQALGHAQALLRHDPLHEPAYAHVMRLNALSDDRASALNLAEVVAACGRPCRYDILCETPGDSYDFSHEKLREVCYHSMSAAHRRWVQQRLDEASPSGARAA